MRKSYLTCFSKDYFRQAIERLMSITPLNGNIDLKDHYLAFIELGNFGIENEIPDERFVCRNHNISDYFLLQAICSAVKGYHPT